MSALRVVALPSSHRFRAGDDLAAHLLEAVTVAGERLVDGDVVCVASKVVSLAEDASVTLDDGDPREMRRLVATERAAAVVADTPHVLVTRTHHGFVAANGGVDASNVAPGLALLLPDDPDASAALLRDTIERRTGARVGVVVTDTFGRPWRVGQTDVALGVAGTAAIRDERGGTDLHGRPLEVTQVAVADEVAAAADLVRHKASGTPFVLLRGLAPAGPPGRGRDLVRPPADDLFAAGGPTMSERVVAARRTIRHLDPDRPVPPEVLRAAVSAAATAPAPHHTRPWRFVRLLASTRTRLLDAMARRWEADLVADDVDRATIDRRQRRSDQLLRPAPELLVPFVALDDAHDYPDDRRTTAERDLFVLSAGAALQSLLLVLTGHGLGTAWVSATSFCPDVVRTSLEVPRTWQPAGLVAVGWPAGDPPRPRPAVDADEFLLER